MKIYFEDKGQDFLVWELKKINDKLVEVIDSQPFQNFVWKGQKLLFASLQVGQPPIFDNWDVLDTKVIKIEGFKPMKQKVRNLSKVN
jgi:hypothetical protein